MWAFSSWLFPGIFGFLGSYWLRFPANMCQNSPKTKHSSQNVDNIWTSGVVESPIFEKYRIVENGAIFFSKKRGEQFYLIGGWTNPWMKNMLAKVDHFPKVSGRKKNVWNHHPNIHSKSLPGTLFLLLQKFIVLAYPDLTFMDGLGLEICKNDGTR